MVGGGARDGRGGASGGFQRPTRTPPRVMPQRRDDGRSEKQKKRLFSPAGREGPRGARSRQSRSLPPGPAGPRLHDRAAEHVLEGGRDGSVAGEAVAEEGLGALLGLEGAEERRGGGRAGGERSLLRPERRWGGGVREHTSGEFLFPSLREGCCKRAGQNRLRRTTNAARRRKAASRKETQGERTRGATGCSRQPRGQGRSDADAGAGAHEGLEELLGDLVDELHGGGRHGRGGRRGLDGGRVGRRRGLDGGREDGRRGGCGGWREGGAGRDYYMRRCEQTGHRRRAAARS